MAHSVDIEGSKLELSIVSDRFSEEDIRHRIYTIRGVQVMLDKDLAELFEVTTGALNQAVKRNIARFPERFMFQLDEQEFAIWKSQIVITNSIKMGLRQRPYAFTEQGVSQLSSVLKSKRAIAMSIRIIDAFVAMRRYLVANAGLLQRLEHIEIKQLENEQWKLKVGERFDQILDRMEDGSLKHKLGIFFNNQMFDAYVVVEEIVKRCKLRLVLIDDYVDGDVLERFRARSKGATVDVYVQNIHKTRSMETAFEAYHRQYPTEHVELHTFNLSHDRWLIVDDEVYHFGASIKDLGKKWFEVSRITEYTADELLARIHQ